MDRYDVINVVGIVLAIFGLLAVPFTEIDGGGVTAYQLYAQFAHLHWSFSYFPAILAIIVVGALALLMTQFTNYRLYRYHLCWIWLFALVVEVIFALNIQPQLETRDLISMTGVSAFSFPITVIALGLLFVYDLAVLDLRRNKPKARRRGKRHEELRFVILWATIVPLAAAFGVLVGYGSVLGSLLGAALVLVIIRYLKTKT